MAELFVDSLAAYGAIGLLFALFFVSRGVAQLDPIAKNAGLGFRLMIFPGAAALWPVLLRRQLKNRSQGG